MADGSFAFIFPIGIALIAILIVIAIYLLWRGLLHPTLELIALWLRFEQIKELIGKLRDKNATAKTKRKGR